MAIKQLVPKKSCCVDLTSNGSSVQELTRYFAGATLEILASAAERASSKTARRSPRSRWRRTRESA
eukprot:6101086-Pleurochrysis_carterae.AAC.1